MHIDILSYAVLSPERDILGGLSGRRKTREGHVQNWPIAVFVSVW